MKNFNIMCRKSATWNSGITTRLAEYGYNNRENQENYNKKAMLQKLQELSLVRPEEEESLLLWWEKPAAGVCDEVYLVSPVMLAMLFKEYELAEKLIDQGYYADDLLIGEQIYYENISFGTAVYTTIGISQLLTSQKDIPESLFRKLCKETADMGLDYQFDYWINPFLWEQMEEASLKKMRPVWCLNRIWEYDRELFRGMLENTRNYFIEELLPSEESEYKKTIRMLALYLTGFPEDLKVLLNEFGFHSEEIGVFDEGKLKAWVKLLPEVAVSCSYEEESKKHFFEHVAYLYLCIALDKNGLKPHQRKQFLNKILPILQQGCPKEYTAEDFLEFIFNNIKWEKYAEMFAVWKHILKKPVQFEKMDASFWSMLKEMFGKKVDLDEFFDEDDYELDSNCRFYMNESRISESIRFLEQLEGIQWSYDAADEDERWNLAYLFSALLDFQSEELLLACLKINLIPKETLPELAKCALMNGGKKLLPLLILFQNQKS